MKYNIKVSVIIPVYNAEKYLNKCIDSIINQTLKEIEIICVNDGSIDSSLNILENYKNKDNRIIIINQKNLRQAAARNNGMKIAKGEYISFIDSDDFVENNFLENMYNEAKNNDSDIAVSNVKSFINDNYLINDIYVGYWCFYNYHSNVLINAEDKFGVIYSCAIWNKIYRRDFLIKNNIYFFENLFLEDVSFNNIAAILSNKIILLKDTWYYYNRGNESSFMVNAEISKRTLDMINMTKKSREFLKNKLYNDASKIYCQILDSFEIYNLLGWLNQINIKYRNKYYKLLRKTFINLNIENNDFILKEYLQSYNEVIKYKNYISFLYKKNINRIFGIVNTYEYKILFIIFIRITIKNVR